MTFKPLSSRTRAIAAAGGLVLALFAAAPVSAADNVQFGFNFGNGDFSVTFGNGGFNGRHFAPAPPACLTKDQLRQRLRSQGYRFINFEGTRYGWTHTTARRNGQLFSFDTNTCNGAVANLVARNRFPGGGFGGNPGWRLRRLPLRRIWRRLRLSRVAALI